MSDAETIEHPETTVGDDDGAHIVDGIKNPAEAHVWTALCGAQCFAWDDGTLDPPEFNFYLLGHVGGTDVCKACVAARDRGLEPK